MNHPERFIGVVVIARSLISSIHLCILTDSHVQPRECTLEVLGEPARALQLALDNWEQQKELRDARNVLEAAVQLGDAKPARRVIDFLTDHGTEDGTLQRLAKKLELLE